ncbi:hypothetical protein [Geobacillus icigianus]|uniref:Uncharacterized protein n=1 Tax=Geobacillus icigianus TaxID=1430331 RepID=A0ABU6BJQ9_9BACL|nr:hypothetical protein [Geobacillus icigianus]MEB3752202.1 hypothetical protein [Geobacillus icigianus]
MVYIKRPDHLLVAVVFDKYSKLHVKTLIGTYGEFLPRVDLSNRSQKERVFIDTDSHLIICLNNCVKRKSDLHKVLDSIRIRGYNMNIYQVLKDAHYALEFYTKTDVYNQPVYKGPSSVKRDAIMIKHYISARLNDIGLYHDYMKCDVPPVELGSYLRAVVR